MTEPTTQLLSESQVAKMTGLSMGTLRTWRCRRKGPPFRKLSSRVMYDERDVNVWIDSQPRTVTEA